MNRTTALIAGIALCAIGTAYGLYRVMDKGDWPGTWPKELEPLRKQARTLVGPLADNRHYAITFTKREEFEAAWPHILKVRSKGASVDLVRAPNFFLGGAKAGVVVHTPPIDGKGNTGGELENTYIELVVDGEIVDLNRIPLPPDTPIHDRRFKDAKDK